MSDPSLDITRIAELARIPLTEEEKSTFPGQLKQIIAHIEHLSSVDVTGIEPTAHPTPVFGALRPDTPLPGLSQDQALLNAPQMKHQQIQVPPVIDPS